MKINHTHFSQGSYTLRGLPQWLSGKEFSCTEGDVYLIPGLERFPGEGNLSVFVPGDIPCKEEPGGLQSKGSQDTT